MEAHAKQELKTGTTTIGMVYKSGVLLAADMKATMGYLSYETEAKKIIPVTSHVAATTAGSVADTEVLLRYLQSHARLFELERNSKMTALAMTTYLSNLLNQYRFYPYEVQFIFGGTVKKPQLVELGPSGSILERSKFATTGSGTTLALSILDDGYEKNMAEEQAIELAVRSVQAARRRDIFSGGRSINVMLADANGLRSVDEAKVTGLLNKLKKEE